MKKAVAFVPEVAFDGSLVSKAKLAPELFLISPKHKLAVQLENAINAKGYKITEGMFLYYEGTPKGDSTLYEVFQSYCLALTFYYDGRATCRAIKEFDNDEKPDIDFYIDEYDQFGYDPDDKILLERKNARLIKPLYQRVATQLAIKDFNALRNSLEFFILFLNEPQIRTRLLYLSICLESLLLEGNDSEGLAYKLGIRCALLLHRFDKTIDKQLTCIEVRNGYNLRSKIIHGGDYKKHSEEILKKKKGSATSELDHVLILERILKKVYQTILSSEDLYNETCKNQLGTRIDQDLVLKN